MIQTGEIGRLARRCLVANPDGDLLRGEFVPAVRIATRIRFLVRDNILNLSRSIQETVDRRDPGRPLSMDCDPVQNLDQVGLTPTLLDTVFEEVVAWFREAETRRPSGE